MSVTRINKFQAKESMATALHEVLKSIVPLVEQSQGCVSCQVLKNQEDQNEFVVIEVWSSISAHQASVKSVPPEKIGTVVPLLASPPAVRITPRESVRGRFGGQGMKPQSKSSTTLPIRHFKQQKDWSNWLAKNHDTSPGLWLQIAKKDASTQSVSYDEAIEAALCFGWIDGQKRAHSERFWLQKFTPRSEKSVWSKINKDKALALIKTGMMQPAGLREIERAKSDGRWDAAYDSASKATVPSDFQSALDGNPRAKSFFEMLDSRNRYAVLFRIQTAKNAETRARKIAHFVQMLEQHEKVHSRPIQSLCSDVSPSFRRTAEFNR